MFKDKTTHTANIETMLLKSLTSWQEHNVQNENEAFKHFYHKSEYMLRMFWQCRFSKMNADDKALNLWITENYLPKEYSFDKTKLNEPQLANLDVGHEELSHIVLTEVWKDYLNSDLNNVVKPPKEKVGFFKKLFR